MSYSRHPRLRRIKAWIASLGLTLSLLVSPLAIGTGAVVALTPNAAFAIPTSTVASVPDTLDRVWTVVKEGMITASKVAWRNGVRSFFEKIAYDSAVFLASFGENQTPLINPDSVWDYLVSAGDAALGEFLNNLATQNGFINLNLCDLPTIQSVQIQLLLPKILAVEPYTPDCTFSEIKDSLSDYADNFQEQWALIMDDPSVFINVQAQFDSGDNALNALITTWGEAMGAKQKAEEAAAIERTKSDFKDLKDDISNRIKTPAEIVGLSAEMSISKSTEAEIAFTDNIVADTLLVFTSTLTSKLMDRIGSGIIDFFTNIDIADSLSGNSSTAAAGAGVAGAREQYASFKSVSFNPGGTVDILTQFAACPDKGADVTNCVISENFRLAIEEQLTLKQAVDQGLLDGSMPFAFDPSNSGAPIEDPNAGIPYRSVEILKQYNVVPVGWVLAAQYMDDFDGNALTLQELMDAYDKCNESDYSPYCGLVDPNWTLKAPEAYCKAEGYAETIANQQFEDMDGSDYTPEANLISRLTSCIDAQTCLSTDDNGNCEAYGYCTQQEAIYQFEGESCPEYMASCTQYTSADNEKLAYLTNTLNFNDCSADTVGCQWYCTVYNTVDSAFQCAAQGMIYPTCTTSGGCSCTDADTAETCTIAEGGFQCSTSSGATCRGAAVAETAEGVDSAISFDNDVEACDGSAEGCTEYIPVYGGANLLPNGSFEHFNTYHEVDETALDDLGAVNDDAATSPYDDTFGFYGTDGAGAPCTETSGSQTCYGWQLVDAAKARAVNDSADGSVAIQLENTGSLVAVVDTGSPLANRTFSFSFDYMHTSATECDAEYSVRPNDGSTTPSAISTTYYTGNSFTSIDAEQWTFADSVTTHEIRITIDAPTGCALVIDRAHLEESDGFASFAEYADSDVLTFVNMNETTTCDVEVVGCELYTPVTGESDIPVPGIITNALSDVCGNGDDFSDPACSQCEEQYVGCDAYIPVATVYSAPINTVSGFTDPTTLDADLAAGIAQRTGYYCEGTETACSPERAELDCGSASIQCLPSISIIPDTGTQCSVQEVGCEEYVNVDEEAAGGEGLEYYTYIRQCVKPSDEQVSADEIDTFYTFEGSDVTGYQIRSWYLKQSNVDGGPCTNLDVFGDSAQTTSADCIDTTSTQYSCDATDVGVDPDCTEYYDDSGNVYYRLASTTITVSDSCQALRNTLDDRLYYSIPSENTTCSASANMCREFKGSEGGAVTNIVDEDFDSVVWTQGEVSSTVITASTGQSMAIGAGTTNGYESAYADVSTSIDADTSYIVTFWAKASEGDVTLTPFFMSGSTVSPFEDAATLSTDWKRYQLGPVVLETVNGDEQFGFAVSSSTSSSSYIVYVDNVVLSESQSHYLIAGTADLCDGYEGCEEYTDTADQTHYLKSFTKLCDEAEVGCESVIATQHSNNPFYTTYNTENEFSQDDVVVAGDEVMNVIVTDSVLCQSDEASCEAFGLPDLDAAENAESFTTVYVMNDPDEYDTALCQEQQRQCSEYTDGATGSTVYFKDPGDKYCEYNAADGEWQTPEGEACPLQNIDSSAAPSQPKGAICNGGVREGELCSSDAQCPNEDGETYARCVSNEDENSGWVGVCEDAYNGCTMYVDPNPKTEVDNAQFETDIKDNTDLTSSTPDGKPDSWTMVDNEFNPFFTASFTSDGGPDSGSLAGCSIFEQSADHVFDREASIKLQAGTTDDIWCFVQSDDVITINRNAQYTLSGHIWLDDANDRFAVGVLYYDADGDQIYYEDTARTTALTVEDIAFGAFAGGTRSSQTLATGQWLRFSGNIGPNLEHEFPEDAYYARVFIEARETGTDSSVYFDSIQFGENQQYAYIAETVDGSSSSNVNSCNGDVDIANGCVAFRDTTSDDLTTLSVVDAETAVNSGFTTTPCVFDSGVESENCGELANAADSNVVLKVQNDRQCAEWLTCIYSRPNYDESGNLISTTCMQIGRCTSRNEDTGECIELAPVVAASTLGYDDDIMATSQPGNTDSLVDIATLSGFSTVGVEWSGVCVDSVCVGGANNGNTCSTNDGCSSANTIYGYYTPDMMPQQGSAGASASEDIIPNGDFEAVYCNGEGTFDPDVAGLSDKTADAIASGEISLSTEFASLTQSRDKGLTCTLDAQCRTAQLEAKVESILDIAEENRDLDSVYYSAGWCSNVNQTSQTWGDWGSDGRADLVIIDYQNGYVDGATYTPASSDSDDAIKEDQYATSYGSGRLDLNNVMLVTPEENADGGVRVNLGTTISNDSEYVVSFDAQYMGTPTATDFIQVGLGHGTSSGVNVDYFERGTSMADIVFIVDASSTMSDEIDNVASATSALVSGLEAADVDYQTAIITTGGNRAPSVVDFDDYADSSGAGSNYGSADGISRDFTTSSSEFSVVMGYIADNLDAGPAYNYEALVSLASGTVNGHELNLRSGAMKFVVLVTDTEPENGDDYITGNDSSGWDEDDEVTASDAIDGAPYVLYTIVASDAAAAYDQLTEEFGGAQYDLASTSYDDVLSDISGAMTELVSAFRFSTAYERYTLGPITVSNKEDADEDTYLFIRQLAGSSNIPFVIDNISLLPALEVNKENNPSSDNSTWLISRDCRAYPEDSSVSCDYSDDAGTMYQGWKGYCLQYDKDLTSTTDLDESNRCVSWWPVDVIAGEPDNVNRDRVQYEGSYPVYSCLVAKGNASLSVCYGTSDGTDGLLCNSDSDCSGGVCLGTSDTIEDDEAVYFYSDSTERTYGLDSTYTNENYVVHREFLTLILDYHSPHLCENGTAGCTSFGHDWESAFFHKFNAEPNEDTGFSDLPIESSIHISEIDDIHFYLGDPYIDSSFMSSGVDEAMYEKAKNTWNIGGNNFRLRSDLQNTGHEKMFIAESELYMENIDGANGWFFQCNNHTNDPDCIGIYALQKAAWCGDEPCSEDSTSAEWNDVDFTYVKAVMPKTEDNTMNQEIVPILEQEEDPFDAISELQASAATWSDKQGKGDSGHIRGGNYVGDQVFGDFFQSEQTENLGFSESPDPSDFKDPDDICFSAFQDNCGANIVGVKFDFQDGYLQAVYLFYWAGMRNTDFMSINNVYWEFALREPCLVAVEAVDDSASTTPWMTRVSGSPTYTIDGTNVAYDTLYNSSVYGKIGVDLENQPIETEGTIDGVDYDWLSGLQAFADDALYNGSTYDFVTGYGSKLPYIGMSTSASLGRGLPFACIGECEASVCSGNDAGGFAKEGESSTNEYYEPAVSGDGASCSQGYTGVPQGICSENGNFCNDNGDCTGGPEDTCVSGDWSNKGTSGGSYYEQLAAATEEAWQRYRLIFPTLGGGSEPTALKNAKLYYAPANDNVSTTAFAYVPYLADESIASSELSTAFDENNNGTLDFEDMEQCDEARDNTDYCYMQPTVSNIIVNNGMSGDIEIPNGTYVSLQFDSYVDVDQQPLKYISIEWLGDLDSSSFNDSETAQPDAWEAASTYGHAYAYAYTCDPTSSYYDSDVQACAYELRVQIQDNWGFCSGESATTQTRVHSGNDGACTSYDAYNGTIYVKP